MPSQYLQYQSKSIFTATLWILGSRGARIVVVILTQIILARVLGVSEFGQLSYVVSIALFLTQFIDFGLGPATGRCMAKATYSEIKVIRKTFGVALLIRFFQGIILFLILIALMFFSDEIAMNLNLHKTIIYSAFIYAYSTSFVTLLEQIYLSLSTQKLLLPLTLITYVLTNIVIIAIIFKWRNYVIIFWCMSITTTLSAIVSIYLSRKWFSEVSIGWDNKIFYEIFSYMIPMFILFLSAIVYTRSSSVILGYLGYKNDVALYTITVSIIEKIGLPVGALGVALGPHFANPDKTLLGSMLTNGIRRGLVIILGISGFLYVSGRPIVHLLLGPEYDGAVVVLRIFIPFLVMFSIMSIVNQSLDYSGFAGKRAMAAIITSFINVLLLIIAIPRWGIIGATIMPQISYSIYTVMMFFLINANYDLFLMSIWRTLIYSLFCASTAAVITRILMNLTSMAYKSNVFIIFIGSLIFSVIYIITVWILGEIDFKEIKYKISKATLQNLTQKMQL